MNDPMADIWFYVLKTKVGDDRESKWIERRVPVTNVLFHESETNPEIGAYVRKALLPAADRDIAEQGIAGAILEREWWIAGFRSDYFIQTRESRRLTGEGWDQ